MNKTLALLIGAVIVIGGGVAFFVARGDSDDSVKVTNSATGQTTEIKTGDAALVSVDACDVLTESAAKQILGDTATKGDTQAGNASSEALSVSNCIYQVQATTGTALERARNVKGVSVLARSAKTKAGADGNKAIFSGSKPAGVQDVGGIGDKAFFNPNSFGQLSVLKGGNYYIVSNYTGNPPVSTLDADKALASLLDFK